jgi:hypothetical protein
VAALSIYSTKQLRNSAAQVMRGVTYPSGAYVTMTTPFAAFAQSAVSDHLFGVQKPVDTWVMICSARSPAFYPVKRDVAAAEPDFYYAPGAAYPPGVTNIAPDALGVNPMPTG